LTKILGDTLLYLQVKKYIQKTTVAGRFCRQLSSTAATATPVAAAKPPLPPPSPPWLNSPSSIAKKRGNSSTTTSMPTTVPTGKRLQVLSTWTYLTYLLFEVSDVGQGNSAISKLLALKKFGPFFFAIYILSLASKCRRLFFSIFSQPTSQVTNSIQENLLRHLQ
jgi:hypothetical protein